MAVRQRDHTVSRCRSQVARGKALGPGPDPTSNEWVLYPAVLACASLYSPKVYYDTLSNNFNFHR